jgi:peptide/nickel transport system ATP-binding protein
MPAEAVLRASRLTKVFTTGGFGRVTAIEAVSDVSFEIGEGEVVALVGESGSGKTTIGRMVAGIESITSGRVELAPRQAPAEARDRGRRRVQVVFQDPYASLNPFNSVGYTLSRPLLNCQRVRPNEARQRILELLATVQLTPPEAFIDKRPHELSGGQRQRVVVARALAAAPEIVVADEPVSMLDVSIRADVLHLLRGLLEQGRVRAMLYITHDLLSARLLARRILVLYRGVLVESGSTAAIVSEPLHPYTQLLWSAIPNPKRAARGDRVVVPAAGSTPAPRAGCPFAPRCPLVVDRCWQERPALVAVDAGRAVACHVAAPRQRAG